MSSPPRSSPSLLWSTALFGCAALSGYRIGRSRYHGPVTDHFDGRHFRNQTGRRQSGFGPLLRWALQRQPGPWRKWNSTVVPGEPPPERVGRGRLRATPVNHSTVLLQMDGLNVLTDPVWSERASPVPFAGPRRHHVPGLRFTDLPPLDVVLLSHNHYDHCDLPTLRRLAREHDPLFVVSLGNRAPLLREGLRRVREVDWWEGVSVGGVAITSVPAEHFAARGLGDRNETLWCGYVLDGAGGPVYFAGDTAYGPHFGQVRERFGPPRLALLPIGAYRPRHIMKNVHMGPDEAVRAHRELGAARSIPIHHGTFALADDGEDEALKRLQAAAHGEAFTAVPFGQGWEAGEPD